MENNIGNNMPPARELNQVSSAVLSKPKGHKNKIIAIIVLAIIAIVVCSLYFFKESLSVKNWYVWTNVIAGFKISYPPDWKPYYTNSSQNNYVNFQSVNGSGPMVAVDMYYTKNDLEKNVSAILVNKNIIKKQSTSTVDGILATKVNLATSPTTVIYFQDKQRFFILKFFNVNRFMVNNFASTFRVTSIEQETSNWKVYKDKDYGFEFRYPINWPIKVDLKGSNSITVGDFVDDPSTYPKCFLVFNFVFSGDSYTEKPYRYHYTNTSGDDKESDDCDETLVEIISSFKRNE